MQSLTYTGRRRRPEGGCPEAFVEAIRSAAAFHRPVDAHHRVRDPFRLGPMHSTRDPIRRPHHEPNSNSEAASTTQTQSGH
jgi:hypothetical protein